MAEPAVGASPLPASPPRRRKLWEIQASHMCSICGTCLTLAELRKIARKAKLQLKPGTTDHELHGMLVHASHDGGLIAKFVHKTLDAKFHAAIERVRRVADEDALAAFWDEARDADEVPGAYWALMTHPHVSETLIRRMFGEVHMLSHLMGAANRADLARLQRLQDETAAASEEIKGLHRRLSERDRRVAALESDAQDRAAAFAVVSAERDALAARARTLEADGTVRELETRLAEQARALENATRAATAERKHAEVRQAALEQTSATLRDAMAQLQAQRAEAAALEQMLQGGLDGVMRSGTAAQPAHIDLGGRRVVYVGGRTNLVSHYRVLVENAGGRFVHHDGGLEDCDARLGQVLGQADVVLCPVDCVSHQACLAAKDFCKRNARTFVPLRSAGLSSFAHGLRALASTL